MDCAEYSLRDDLTLLTGLSTNKIYELATTSIDVIAQCTLEAKKNGQEYCSIDLGFGSLNIKIDGDDAEYKFIPSRRFIVTTQEALESGVGPIESRAADKVSERMLRIYKELI